VQEPTTTKRDERRKENREFCLVLFNKILKVQITEEDTKLFSRSGKIDSVQQGVTESAQRRKARPMLIQHQDRILKNMVMESVDKLKEVEEKHSRIIFMHDINTKDRVAEAKN